MSVAAEEHTLRVPDADGRLKEVRLHSDLFKRAEAPAFEQIGGSRWPETRDSPRV